MTPLAPVIAVAAACLYTPLDTDAYLFSLYERAPKFDNSGEFGWKDEEAAARLGMTLKEYVIGGVDQKFRITYARAMNFMEMVYGLKPAINSAYRDNYRQRLVADRRKAAVGYSFHGRYGWGHGLAIDTVSAGATSKVQAEREAANQPVLDWIDKYGPAWEIGRAYGDRDAPHVTPTWSREYAAHHGGHTVRHARHRSHGKKRIRIAHQT